MTIGSLNRKPKQNFTYNKNLLENVIEFYIIFWSFVQKCPERDAFY